MASKDDSERSVSPPIDQSTTTLLTTGTASTTSYPERGGLSSSNDLSRRCPHFERRPHSDYGYVHRKIKINTIEEDAIQQHENIARRANGRDTGHTRSGTSKSTTSASASATSITRTATRTNRDAVSVLDDVSQTPRPTSRPISGHKWSRTTSGSVWYEKLRGSTETSSPSGSVQELSPKALTPLPPPRSPQRQPGPPFHHTVRIEKSFSKSQNTDAGQDVPLPTSRRSSINPRKIFSAPLELVRRLSFSKKKYKAVEPARVSPTLSTRARQLADHTTLLRRNKTSEALRRVDSILRDTNLASDSTSPVSVITPTRIRTLSEHTTSSRTSSPLRNKSKKPQNAVPGILVDSELSLQQVPTTSYTSSQLALRMGIPPNNTPDERATYRVKRSPSAESEEFLKVDISIRGGTSYLPSEARRIHTPPLPQEGLDGKRRGFFFDYDAPKRAESPPENTIDASSIPQRSTSRASTVGKKAFLSAGRIVVKARTNDWYDAKLAELDESEEATQTTVPSRKVEEQFDLTIPEHLPSSPLCPRHPKYWRVVKGKGSQYRGCWMHGVGPRENPAPS